MRESGLPSSALEEISKCLRKFDNRATGRHIMWRTVQPCISVGQTKDVPSGGLHCQDS